MILEDLDMELGKAIQNNQNVLRFCDIEVGQAELEKVLYSRKRKYTIIYSDVDVLPNGSKRTIMVYRERVLRSIYRYSAFKVIEDRKHKVHTYKEKVLFVDTISGHIEYFDAWMGAEIAVFNEQTGTCKFTEHWKGGGVDEK